MDRCGFSDSKVDYFYNGLIIAYRYQHIAWFNVTVNDALLVSMFNGTADILKELSRSRSATRL